MLRNVSVTAAMRWLEAFATSNAHAAPFIRQVIDYVYALERRLAAYESVMVDDGK